MISLGQSTDPNVRFHGTTSISDSYINKVRDAKGDASLIKQSTFEILWDKISDGFFGTHRKEAKEIFREFVERYSTIETSKDLTDTLFSFCKLTALASEPFKKDFYLYTSEFSIEAIFTIFDKIQPELQFSAELKGYHIYPMTLLEDVTTELIRNSIGLHEVPFLADKLSEHYKCDIYEYEQAKMNSLATKDLYSVTGTSKVRAILDSIVDPIDTKSTALHTSSPIPEDFLPDESSSFSFQSSHKSMLTPDIIV
jgi:hypothetical protein